MTRKTASEKKARKRGIADARLDAASLERALTEAEGRIIQPPEDAENIVRVKPEHIDTIPALFQPRTFTYGYHTLDNIHVQQLLSMIRAQGELDPVTVVKLRTSPIYEEGEGERWVCVDGHHRLEAYKEARWEAPIQCVWFRGSARAAHLRSISDNTKIKLPLSRESKQEVAWKLTLLGLASKDETHRLAKVSEGVISEMRRVKRLYEENSLEGQQFRQRLGEPLNKTRWGHARAVFRHIEPSQQDIQERAGRLANTIATRLTDLLKRDYAVTARALVIHDEALAEALVSELATALEEHRKENGGE
ncbi:ParB N-terminal domain-containing protein [Pseudorhodoplanes sp.]|uniref:ParB N-terminal domain-containing protein n=1 Tax=Pseudorhodoplanes sp. TaxID=1934341 RepID=UPI0039198F0B